MSALKFADKYFPNLEKIKIYQELFYIYQGNRGYFELVQEIM